MKPEEYTSQSGALFKKWTERFKNDAKLVPDGAVDPERYYASKPRIVFLLKEMNASFWDENNLVKFLAENGGRGKTWNNVVRWTRVIREILGSAPAGVPTYEVQGAVDRKAREEVLKGIAVVNMKKLPGTGNSHMPTINLHAERYGDLLAEQLELLDPDVIIAGGVGLEHIKDLALKQPSDHWSLAHFRGRERLFIWSYHPAARGKDHYSFDRLVDICSQVEKKHGRSWIL